MVRIRCFLLTILAVLVNCPVTQNQFCYAHPFHTSLTEMDWNEKSARWEVGLRVYAGDLELAVRQYQPQIVLDSENLDLTETRHCIQSYLQARFYLTDQTSPPLPERSNT